MSKALEEQSAKVNRLEQDEKDLDRYSATFISFCWNFEASLHLGDGDASLSFIVAKRRRSRRR